MRTRCARGGIALAIALTAAACGGGDGYSTPTTPTPTTGGGGGTAATVTVNINASSGSQAFNPNPATMATTGTVAWANRDGAVHRIVANDASFDTGDIVPGATSRAITVPAVAMVAGFGLNACDPDDALMLTVTVAAVPPPPPVVGLGVVGVE